MFVSNYVISDYGTKAVMGVPAHDERDRDFATEFNLPVIQVVNDDEVLVNSHKFNGLSVESGRNKVVEVAKVRVCCVVGLYDSVVIVSLP